ncbi:hypothetical protein P168DRAFT_26356 [Aspergillus campestris IBT 28561]|uniref:Uncharacterized protein n=1 Tax=Aspergillus campestris (strain IBT 28561) TaxID=1392248 RepID=A0A2I1DGB2_ASPC2|nr:uncharacterized protein P168DRAFT_26356 [Aspergillus campestris IBT 28561]PKY08915.1 hypothetical protein P168DRAFT_26356 [Aspergillus campestris IBT 28561]
MDGVDWVEYRRMTPHGPTPHIPIIRLFYYFIMIYSVIFLWLLFYSIDVIESGTSQKVTVSASLSRFLLSSPILFPDYLTRFLHFSFSPLLPHIYLFLPSSILLFLPLLISLSDLHLLSDTFLPILYTLRDFLFSYCPVRFLA